MEVIKRSGEVVEVTQIKSIKLFEGSTNSLCLDG